MEVAGRSLGRRARRPHRGDVPGIGAATATDQRQVRPAPSRTHPRCTPNSASSANLSTHCSARLVEIRCRPVEPGSDDQRRCGITPLTLLFSRPGSRSVQRPRQSGQGPRRRARGRRRSTPATRTVECPVESPDDDRAGRACRGHRRPGACAPRSDAGRPAERTRASSRAAPSMCSGVARRTTAIRVRRSASLGG